MNCVQAFAGPINPPKPQPTWPIRTQQQVRVTRQQQRWLSEQQKAIEPVQEEPAKQLPDSKILPTQKIPVPEPCQPEAQQQQIAVADADVAAEPVSFERVTLVKTEQQIAAAEPTEEPTDKPVLFARITLVKIAPRQPPETSAPTDSVVAPLNRDSYAHAIKPASAELVFGGDAVAQAECMTKALALTKRAPRKYATRGGKGGEVVTAGKRTLPSPPAGEPKRQKQRSISNSANLTTVSQDAWKQLYAGSPPKKFGKTHYQQRADYAAKLDAAIIKRRNNKITFAPDWFLAVRMLLSEKGSFSGECELLVSWKGYAERNATWEPTSKYPDDRVMIEALVRELRAVHAEYGCVQLATPEA